MKKIASRFSLSQKNLRACMWIAVGVAFVVLLYIATFSLIQTYFHATVFNGYFANGAFQLYNPLLRIADGQQYGKDFIFFHGIGTLYIHYPIFALAGQNLFASEFARYLVTPVLAFVSVSLFLFSFLRDWKKTFVFSALLMLVYVSKISWLPNTVALISPSNSIISVRIFMPVIAAAFAIYCIRSGKERLEYSRHSIPVFELGTAILLGTAFFFSVEQGLASILAFTLCFFLFYPHSSLIVRFRNTAVVASVAMLTIFILFYIVSGEAVFDVLHYYLQELPSDQFWFFGAPPAPYSESLTALFSVAYVKKILIVTLLVIGILLSLYSRYTDLRKEITVMFFLLVYGMVAAFIPMLGIYAAGYLLSLIRNLIFVIAWLVIFAAPFVYHDLSTSKIPFNKIIGRYTSMSVLFCTVTIAGYLIMTNDYSHYRLSNLIDIAETIGADADRIEPAKRHGVYTSTSWKRKYDLHSKVTGLYAIDIHPTNTADGVFVNGIDNAGKRVLLSHMPRPKRSFAVGDTIRFPYSGDRTITVLQNELGYMVVHFDGEPLDPNRDGYPGVVLINPPAEMPVIWSTYMNTFDAEAGNFLPVDDYIIHALGDTRREQYVDSFNEVQPDVVKTARKSYFKYEPWLQYGYWEFYKTILYNYVPAGQDPSQILWVRDSGKWKVDDKSNNWQEIDLGSYNEDDSERSIPLEGIDGPLIEVEFTYEAHQPLAWLPTLGSISRHLIMIEIEGASTEEQPLPVSVPPHKKTWTVPVYIGEHESISIDTITTQPITRSSFSVTGLRYRAVSASKKRVEYMFDSLEQKVNEE